MRVRGVLFDFDHTLVHSPLDFAAMRRAIYHELDAVGWRTDGRDGKLMLELIEEAASELPASVAAPLRERCHDAILSEELRAAASAVAIAGAAEALDTLQRAGRATAVITRNAKVVLRAVLRQVPLTCGPVLCRDDVPRVKPHPDHALAALDAIGVAPDQAVLVGDFTADIACARAAGLPGIGVLTGGSDTAALMAAGAVAVLPSVAELPGWLAAQGW